jgi:hypothetical protein
VNLLSRPPLGTFIDLAIKDIAIVGRTTFGGSHSVLATCGDCPEWHEDMGNGIATSMDFVKFLANDCLSASPACSTSSASAKWRRQRELDATNRPCAVFNNLQE